MLLERRPRRSRGRSGSSTRGGELDRGLITQRAVWSVMVVVLLPTAVSLAGGRKFSKSPTPRTRRSRGSSPRSRSPRGWLPSLAHDSASMPSSILSATRCRSTEDRRSRCQKLGRMRLRVFDGFAAPPYLTAASPSIIIPPMAARQYVPMQHPIAITSNMTPQSRSFHRPKTAIG